MVQVATLAGLGKLWNGSKDLGAVDYEIDVSGTGREKRGEGTLRANPRGKWENFQAGQALMLMLRSGEQVSVTVKTAGKDSAAISAAGPMPDPINWDSDDD